jgi:hypothetical protein
MDIVPALLFVENSTKRKGKWVIEPRRWLAVRDDERNLISHAPFDWQPRPL